MGGELEDQSQIAKDQVENAFNVSVSVMRPDVSIDLVISMILTVFEERDHHLWSVSGCVLVEVL